MIATETVIKKIMKKASPSRKTAAKTLYETFKVLKENGGELRAKEVIAALGNRLEFTEWELERYEKTNNIRWQSILHFYTIDAIKAGYLRKNKGTWILTDDGEKAMSQGADLLLDNAKKAYQEWKKEQDGQEEGENEEVEDLGDKEKLHEARLQELDEESTEGLRDFIIKKNPYEFQEMTAALLRAMGYYTPHIASRGKDGGVDIVAYEDPLGAKGTRIKVQVKHQPDSAVSVDEVRKLIGVMTKDADVGLFVTSGRFAGTCQEFSRNSHKHVELIDFERFVSLWQDYYGKFTDEDKAHMPLKPIFFLGDYEI